MPCPYFGGRTTGPNENKILLTVDRTIPGSSVLRMPAMMVGQ